MNIAYIPARGGSKSIPHKNIKSLNGKPLIYWTVAAACGSNDIDKVYLATDSEQITSVALSLKTQSTFICEKLEVIGRSKESAADTASTESAVLEFAEKHQFNNIVLIQPTSPMLITNDLDRGFEVFKQPDTDSVVSCVRQTRFIWEKDKIGYAFPTNYNINARPRRQEFDGFFIENGAFYITSRKALLNSKNRISGRIRMCEMPYETFYELDEETDWIIVEQLMKKRAEDES